jgi:hypothetical protein
MTSRAYVDGDLTAMLTLEQERWHYEQRGRDDRARQLPLR